MAGDAAPPDRMARWTSIVGTDGMGTGRHRRDSPHTPTAKKEPPMLMPVVKEIRKPPMREPRTW
jgi:hypothetical protein